LPSTTINYIPSYPIFQGQLLAYKPLDKMLKGSARTILQEPGNTVVWRASDIKECTSFAEYSTDDKSKVDYMLTFIWFERLLTDVVVVTFR
jgi:hypothetical protein